MSNHLSNTDMLLGLLVALWTVIFTVGAYWMRRISDKIDRLVESREHCIRDFADRQKNDDAHREFYNKLYEHDSQIARIHEKISRIEK